MQSNSCVYIIHINACGKASLSVVCCRLSASQAVQRGPGNDPEQRLTSHGVPTLPGNTVSQSAGNYM